MTTSARSAFLAALALLPLAARADEMDDALAALSKPSSGARAVHDKGDYGMRPGWISKNEEERLLDPFRPLTTAQARKVVPKLIEMLDNPEHVFGNAMGAYYGVANRALEALVVISFQRFGRIATGGELQPPEAYEEEAKQHEEAVKGWTAWWEANKGKEISEWRRAELSAQLSAIRGRAQGPAGASGAIGILAERGLEMHGLLTPEESAIVLAAARDEKEEPGTRIAALHLAFGAGLPETIDVAGEFANARAEDAALSDEGFDLLAALGHEGAARLVALLRKTANSVEGKLAPANEALYAAAQKRLALLAPEVNAGIEVPGARMARIMVVGRYEEWLAGTGKK